jgi:hypothetical protein
MKRARSTLNGRHGRLHVDASPGQGGCHCTSRSGFTLVELLAGMTILIIMVLFLNRIFTESTTMWKLGNKRVASNSDGRAVVDFMVRDLSMAVADGVLNLHLKSGSTNVLGKQSDRLSFVALNNEVEAGERQAREITYYISQMDDHNGFSISNRYRLMRYEEVNTNTLSCYTNQNWWTKASGGVVLMENVRTMEFWVYDQAGTSKPDYDSNPNIHGPPAFVDVCIETLGEDDSIKVAEMPLSSATNYATQVSRRYVGRAYLNNQMGYAVAK